MDASLLTHAHVRPVSAQGSSVRWRRPVSAGAGAPQRTQSGGLCCCSASQRRLQTRPRLQAARVARLHAAGASSAESDTETVVGILSAGTWEQVTAHVKQLAASGRLTVGVADAGFALLKAVEARGEPQLNLTLQRVLALIGEELNSLHAPPSLRLVEQLCAASEAEWGSIIGGAFALGSLTKAELLRDIDDFLELLADGEADFNARVKQAVDSGTDAEFREAKLATDMRAESRATMSRLRDFCNSNSVL